VCAGSALLLAEDESTSVINGALVGVLLSQSTSPSVVIVCSSPERLNLGFLTEGKLDAIFIKPSLGVPNWLVIYFIKSVASVTYFKFNPLGLEYRKLVKSILLPHLGLTKNESQWFSGTQCVHQDFSSHRRHGYIPAECIHVVYRATQDGSWGLTDTSPTYL
jgi:hypothetical protein